MTATNCMRCTHPRLSASARGKRTNVTSSFCKHVGIAATNREGLFIAAMAFEGNPYDGHTLKATAAKAEEMTGVAIQRLYVDKGSEATITTARPRS